MKILLVNGSNFVLEVLSSKLSKSFPKARFVKANHLNSAFDEAELNTLDLIVASFQLPANNSLHIAENLSATGDSGNTPTILFYKNCINEFFELPELPKGDSHVAIAYGMEELLEVAEALLVDTSSFVEAA